MSRRPEHVALDWLAAFNARDVDALLALYSPQAVHLSPKLRDHQPESGGRIQGHAALRAWWSDAFKRLPTLHYALMRLTSGAAHVFIEYTRTVNGEPPSDVAELLEVEGNAIVRSRVFHG